MNMAEIFNFSIPKLTYCDIDKKKLVLWIALYVFLLMSVLASFWAINRNHINLGYIICFVLGYTAIAVICSSAIFYFVSVFFNKQWTVARHFMIVFITSLVIWICDSFYYHICLNINNFSFFKTLEAHFIVIFLLGIAIGGGSSLWIRNKYLYLNLQGNEKQNYNMIPGFLNENTEQKMITLYSNSCKNSIALFPQQLLYMESIGNYVQIYYIIESKILHKKLRSTLSKMEEALKDYHFMVRCHRAFIVNLHQIEKISSSKIWLNPLEMEIPISKTYKSNIHKRLNSINRLSPI